MLLKKLLSIFIVIATGVTCQAGRKANGKNFEHYEYETNNIFDPGHVYVCVICNFRMSVL